MDSISNMTGKVVSFNDYSKDGFAEDSVPNRTSAFLDGVVVGIDSTTTTSTDDSESDDDDDGDRSFAEYSEVASVLVPARNAVALAELSEHDCHADGNFDGGDGGSDTTSESSICSSVSSFFYEDDDDEEENYVEGDDDCYHHISQHLQSHSSSVTGKKVRFGSYITVRTYPLTPTAAAEESGDVGLDWDHISRQQNITLPLVVASDADATQRRRYPPQSPPGEIRYISSVPQHQQRPKGRNKMIQQLSSCSTSSSSSLEQESDIRFGQKASANDTRNARKQSRQDSSQLSPLLIMIDESNH
jgi:hypothetical protein